MIPTRDDIVSFADVNNHAKTTSWLRAMRDEIDNLQKVYELTHDKWSIERRDSNKLRAAIIAIGTEVGAAVDESSTVDFLCEVEGEVKSVVGNLRADLDRANTEAALARDAMAKATTDTCAKVQNELRSVERALCSADVLIKYAAWSRGAYECHVKNTIETAIDALRDDSATTPYSPPFEGDPKDCAFKASDPVREAAIRAWEEEALFDMYEHADDDEKVHQDDAFLVRRREITAAVAMMRSAGDPDAKLRELRAWIIDEKWCAPGIVRKIDEMLARPAPSHVYSRGRTIAESAEPPTAYYPPAPVEIWPEEMKRQTLVGKFEPAPVEQPAAAVPDHVPDAGKMVPDDTRELVAQLADAVVTLCDGQGFGVTLSEVQAIAAKLRGGA